MGWFKKKDKRDQRKPPEKQPAEEIEVYEEEETVIADMFREPTSEEWPAPIVVSSDSRGGFVGRLRKGLSKTREILTTDIDDLFRGARSAEEVLEEIEERLITADIGVQTTMELMEKISGRSARILTPEALKEILRMEILSLINIQEDPGPRITAKPHVIMVLGVNGVGKTTTIGKLAARASDEGKTALIGAADTFRAAAIEQLAVWAHRAGADMVRHRENADPAAVAYDSVEAAMARGRDIVLLDTAGRLHTKVNLMEELKKIKRAMAKKMWDAPHETLLVLDATTGQNAISQAKMFHEAIGVTGIALTKLDGTARGGILVSICSELNIPLKYIGIGERIEDLQKFDPKQFVNALI